MQNLLARALETAVLSKFFFKNKVLNCEYSSACILLSSMGKQKKKKYQRRPKKERESYDDIRKENVLFEKYYKDQKIIPDNEWDDFKQSLQTGLPSTFRITGTRDHAQELMKYLKKYYLESLKNVRLEDGEEMDCSGKALSWYPGELAWQINLTRRFIRRSTVVSSFHKFLVNESEMGNLSRQEAVSMIPPLLVDVESHHKILDLCAAPGSKTAQLIEMLHEKEPTTLPEGFVIANDIDPKRCYMLVHQSRRIHSPCCLVTNHDAAAYPDITIKQEGSEDTSPLLFDRILCDVPCSGDGTLRKNPQIWKKWNPEIGMNIHRTQLRILVRAVEMLAVGGKVVYSTCSLNPVENEAVVSQILLRAKGSLELIDVSDKLPLLKRSHGLNDWLVYTKDGRCVPSFAECSSSDRTHGFLESMWPPSSEEMKIFDLSQCIRLYPHHQDTGGFFIAVLQKKSTLPWVPGHRPGPKLMPWELTKKEKMKIKREKSNTWKATTNEPDEKDDLSSETSLPEGVVKKEPLEATSCGLLLENDDSPVKEPAEKKRKIQQPLRENPFIFLDNADTHWKAIKEFFEISSDFPENNLMVRSTGGRKRVIYFVCSGISTLLRNVDQEQFRVINAGLRIFTRCENSDQMWAFRINGEALETILPFLSTKRVINVPQGDLVKILVDVSPKVSEMTTETKSALGNIGPGCIIFAYNPKNRHANDTLQMRIGVCGWRSKTVILRSLIAKGDRMHYLRICGFAPDSQEIKELESAAKKSEDTSPPAAGEESDDRPPETSFTIDDGPDGAFVITDMGQIPVPSPPPGITDVGFV